MRVITGTARGRKLKELQGRETRPTTDKVKESVFNIVQFDIEGRQVLDLFGGTGQMGIEALSRVVSEYTPSGDQPQAIEALSRGAAHATFVDLRKEAAALIRDNVALCGFTEQARVIQGDYLSFLTGCREKFDLILLDPPYASGFLEKALETAAGIDILSENGIMVCESAAETVLPPLSEPYRKGKDYRYGKIKLTVYRRDA